MNPATGSIQIVEERAQIAAQATPNFDRIAGVYRWMEFATFGPWLQWCRCAFLNELILHQRALVLGDGDGRFTARLLRINPAISVDAVDASPAMLRALLRRAGPSKYRVRPHIVDARLAQSSNFSREESSKIDLVATHFFLDCLTTPEIESLANNLRQSLANDAVWVVSEFAIPSGWFGRFIAWPLVSMLYSIFGWLTGLSVRQLPDYHSALRNAGFTRLRSRSWLHGLLVSELWQQTGR
jgi:SAM-dependent methyltransferase